MSDSGSDDDDIPAREECEKRCQEFAQITGTDTALAMFYLQDRSWDLQRSLNAFFEGNPSASPNKSLTSNEVLANQRAGEKAATVFEDPEPHRIRVLSWNIDGLDQNNLITRTNGVCEIITKEKPDVVFLQEVVKESQERLESLLPHYQMVVGNSAGYYTAMLLHCQTVTYTDHAVTPFHTSKMGRNIIQVQARVKGVDVMLMTSHLESTKNHADERKRQLKICFKMMKDAPSNFTVIFGGDLNLRDPELVLIDGIPDGLYDMWEVTGKRPEAKFTWDCMRNDNLEMSGKFKPRARFDRVYLSHCEPKPKLKPVYFELVGIERLPCQRFPSDHWGILTHYDKV